MPRFSFAQSAPGTSPSTASPISTMSSMRTGSTTGEGMAVMIAVVVESIAIIALRHVFRKHHGG